MRGGLCLSLFSARTSVALGLCHQHAKSSSNFVYLKQNSSFYFLKPYPTPNFLFLEKCQYHLPSSPGWKLPLALLLLHTSRALLQLFFASNIIMQSFLFLFPRIRVTVSNVLPYQHTPISDPSTHRDDFITLSFRLSTSRELSLARMSTSRYSCCHSKLSIFWS